MESDVRDNTFFLGAGSGYLGELMNNGGLGDSERFTKAMGDLGGEVSGALYVDLRAVLQSAGPNDPNVRPLEAVAVSAGRTEAGDYFRLRLVAS